MDDRGGLPRQKRAESAREAVNATRRLHDWAEQESGHVPSWLRAHSGENRLPMLLALAVAVGAQLALPERLSVGPGWVLPAAEIALIAALTIANPLRMHRDSALIRRASLTLVAVISTANAGSVVLLISGLLDGTLPGGARALLSSGAEVYVTNIVGFALWYWELDRGGPLARAVARRHEPDFLFPQMATPAIAGETWRPAFLDYLYLSFTNATAFSPTDTMPLARWAKMLMLVQSSIALITAALVIARAVNIFK